jgi:hypothetical protein
MSPILVLFKWILFDLLRYARLASSPKPDVAASGA